MAFYPVVKIPSRIEEFKNLTPTLATRPKEPQVPQRVTNLPAPPNLIEVKEPTYTKSGAGCFGYVLAAGILAFFFLIASESYNGGVMMIAVILGLIGLWGVNASSNEDQNAYNQYIKNKNEYPKLVQQAKEKYDLELIQYERKLDQLEKNYQDRLEIYKSYEYPMFLENLSAYEREKSLITSSTYLQEFRVQARRNFFHSISKPQSPINSNATKKGMSEDYFLPFLKKKFGDKIFQACSLMIDPTLQFVPDFVLYDKQLGYCIDIEIDEPYIGKNGKPIHFIESTYDQKRDFYFINSGWVVIRFAEQQIMKHPNLCCNYIAGIVNEICSDLVKIEYDNNLMLPQVKRWSKEEAHEMAFNRFRNTYLTKELIENLPKEDQNVPDTIEEKTNKPLPQKTKIEEKRETKISWDDIDDLPF